MMSGEPAPHSASPLVLIVESPSGGVSQSLVERTPFVIGRLRECDLSLRDSRISRRHARISSPDGTYVIEDLESRHGLTVNGIPTSRRDLRIDDRIGFGIPNSYRITVGDDGSRKANLLRKASTFSGASGRSGVLGRLAAMLDVARSVEFSDGVDEVFEAVVEAALAIAGAERAFLLVRNDGGDLEVRAGRDSSGRLLRAGLPLAVARTGSPTPSTTGPTRSPSPSPTRSGPLRTRRRPPQNSTRAARSVFRSSAYELARTTRPASSRAAPTRSARSTWTAASPESRWQRATGRSSRPWRSRCPP